MKSAAGVMCAAVLLCTLMVAPPSASAQGTESSEPTTELVVDSVSAWVDPEGTFRVAFEPNDELPLDATFTWTIGQAIRPGDETIRAALESALENGPPNRVLQAPESVPVLTLGAPAEGLEFELPVRSRSGDADRTLIPTAGVHPVQLVVTDVKGEELWTTTVFLNRLPTTSPTGRDDEPAISTVQLLVGLDSAPAFDADATVDLGDDESALAPTIALLSELEDIPLTVALRPNTLAGLLSAGRRSDQPFIDAARSSPWAFSRQTYVRVDAAGLAGTPGGELTRQLAVGDIWMDQILRRPPDRELWVLDDALDTSAAAELRKAGVRHLVVGASGIEVEGSRPPPSMARTFSVSGVDDLTVSATDPGLARQLTQSCSSPALCAHRASTLMMADWFDAVGSGTEAFPGVNAALDLPPGTDAEAVRELVGSFVDGGPLAILAPSFPTESRGTVATARLLDNQVSDMSSAVASVDRVNRRIRGYESMTTPDNPSAQQWRLVADQIPHIDSTGIQRREYAASVDSAIDTDLAAIVTPADRTIVLTSASATIPLRFRNDLDVPVRLVMRTRSPRLEFPDGDTREIVLEPGENRVDLGVTVQAPGPSLLRIDLSSPDGQLLLPESTLTVRSSSISGVGAGLSLVSLLVLVIWWFRSWRRGRRARVAPSTATVPDSVASGG